MGMIIGKNSKLGQPIDVNNTHEYIFGLVLVNDWSTLEIFKLGNIVPLVLF